MILIKVSRGYSAFKGIVEKKIQRGIGKYFPFLISMSGISDGGDIQLLGQLHGRFCDTILVIVGHAEEISGQILTRTVDKLDGN